MQVRARHEPGRPDVADHLPLSHPVAGFEFVGIAAEMGVSGGIRRVVLDPDIFSEVSVAALLDDDSVAGG